MATKAAHTAFNREVSKYLESIGAEIKVKDGLYMEWILKTIAGDFHICMIEPERTDVFSIYCKFKDVDKAKQFLPSGYHKHLNDYLGKWNFHSYDAKELLEEFKEQIQPLLIKTLTT